MTRVVPTIGQAVPGNFETAAFWNANVQAGLNFLLNPPLFEAYHAGTQSVPNNSFTAMILDTEVFDTEGGHSTTTNSQRYTCSVPGVYELNGAVSFIAGSGGMRGANFQMNGTTALAGSENLITPSAALASTVPAFTTQVRLAINDWVALYGFQTSGGALSTAVVGASNTYFSARWVAA